MRDKNGRFIKKSSVVRTNEIQLWGQVTTEGTLRSEHGCEKCARCNRRVAKGAKFHLRNGLVIGLECDRAVVEVEKHTNKAALIGAAVRRRYQRYVGYLTRLGLERRKAQLSGM